VRISPDLNYELPLWSAGIPDLAGLDEAGRGAWAGPVSAAAVILPHTQYADLCTRLKGVRDSKQMTPRQRFAWAVTIRRIALAWSVGFASQTEIDAMGILPATRLAMQRALAQLALPPQHLLLDAVRLPAVALPQTVLIKGDVHSLSIAAASVLAKTARDELLIAWEQEYPGYGFARHKGYGTAAHRQALQDKGPCPLHRFSFAPIRDLMNH
jgi:ribonuclease HII